MRAARWCDRRRTDLAGRARASTSREFLPRRTKTANDARRGGRQRPDSRAFVDAAQRRSERLVAGVAGGFRIGGRLNQGDDGKARSRGGVGDRSLAAIGVPAQDFCTAPVLSFTRPGGIWKISVPPAAPSTSGRPRKRANVWQSVQSQTKRKPEDGETSRATPRTRSHRQRSGMSAGIRATSMPTMDPNPRVS